MSTCASFLSASRQVAKKDGGWTDRACEVLDNGRGYYLVKSYEGKVIWEGDAHCRYCARAEAITKMTGTKAAA